MSIETPTLTKNTKTSSNLPPVRVLEICTKPASDVKKVFANLDLDVTHINPLADLIPEEWAGTFDIVYIAYALEYLERLRVINTFRNYISMVRNFGEVWVVVPSMEWAANEIINRREGIHVQANLFGTQNEPGEVHKTGFTLQGLRGLVEVCGLFIRKAYQSPYNIMIEDTNFGSLLNVVIAVRVDEINDPAEAIS